VFERFYRADQSRSRQQDGFGLGLSIVKWIAESHHGQVELNSQPGAGSTFTVHLARQ
jgi:signal transduction histidine kinase